MEESVVKSITRAFMFLFKGKNDNFETRLAQSHDKFKDNALVMEQVEFIDESLKGRRKVMTSD